MDTTYSPTPNPASTKVSGAKVVMFGATLFVALVAVVAAVVIPGMKTTDDRSKATSTASCSGSITAPAAICNDKCMTDADCATGLTCQKMDLFSVCRNPQNPTSATCAAAPATAAPTKPPVVGLPTPPPGCTYQTVQCIQAPCDPVLVCTSPTPIPTKAPITTLPTPPAGCTYQQVQCIQAPCDPILVCAPHVVKFVFHSYTSGQNMAIDYIKDGTTIVDDNSSLITYTGTWIKGYDSTPYGGAYAATSTNGSAMSYSTKSSSIIVRPYRYSTRGGLDVYVDGVLKRQINDLNSGSGWSDIAITVTP